MEVPRTWGTKWPYPALLSPPWLFTLKLTQGDPEKLVWSPTSREVFTVFPAPAPQLVPPERETTAGGVTRRPWWERMGSRHSNRALLDQLRWAQGCLCLER